MSKQKKGQKSGFTTPLLQDLVDRTKQDFKIQNAGLVQNPAQEPPDLYQDAGGGYNLNYVFPQE